MFNGSYAIFQYATVRVLCDDLDEGKFNFPMIHAIQSHPNDHRLLGKLVHVVLFA